VDHGECEQKGVFGRLFVFNLQISPVGTPDLSSLSWNYDMKIVQYVLLLGLFFAAVRWTLLALAWYCGIVLVLNLIFRPKETLPIVAGLGVIFTLGSHPFILDALAAVGLGITAVGWWRRE
jgi:hypothetical protein